MRGLRRWVTVAVAVAPLAVVASLAPAPRPTPPAYAFDSLGSTTAPPAASATSRASPPTRPAPSCHAGFKSSRGYTCWSCHAPGQDTSSMSSHQRGLRQARATSAEPGGRCTPRSSPTARIRTSARCRSASAATRPSDGVADPGVSPHHNGGSAGMSPCSRLPQAEGARRHRRLRDLPPTANAFHTYQANSPGFKKCAGCHTMRHAGRSVSGGKCATCHKGTGHGRPEARPALHEVTKKLTCNQSGCHSKALHAAPSAPASPATPATAARSTPSGCPSRATPPASGATARLRGIRTATPAACATATPSTPGSPTLARVPDT